MRAVGGIIAGLVIGFIGIILLGILGVALTYAVPSGLDPYDPDVVIRIVLGMPPATKIALLIALFGGSVAGAATAKAIARRAWPAWFVAALITIYFVLFVLSLPLAAWMQVLTIAVPIVGGLIGNHLVRSAAPAAATTDEAGDATAAQ